MLIVELIGQHLPERNEGPCEHALHSHLGQRHVALHGAESGIGSKCLRRCPDRSTSSSKKGAAMAGDWCGEYTRRGRRRDSRESRRYTGEDKEEGGSLHGLVSAHKGDNNNGDDIQKQGR